MKHLILEHGDLLDVTSGRESPVTVIAFTGVLKAIAHNGNRTAFVFAVNTEVSGDGLLVLHLDKDARPASRLLQLLSGVIPFSIRTAEVTVHSQKKNGVRRGSRLRLSVDGQNIPAPENLPGDEERRSANVSFLEAINSALGTVADIVMGRENNDGVLAVTSLGDVMDMGLDADDAGDVVVRRASSVRAAAETTSAGNDADEDERFADAVRRTASRGRRRRNGTRGLDVHLVSRENYDTIFDRLSGSISRYRTAVRSLNTMLGLCLEFFDGTLTVTGADGAAVKLTMGQDGNVCIVTDDATIRPLATTEVDLAGLPDVLKNALEDIEA